MPGPSNRRTADAVAVPKYAALPYAASLKVSNAPEQITQHVYRKEELRAASSVME
jgi:hypothetical protein